MKKYNTPEMHVSMFNCETVATSEGGTTPTTASQYAYDAKDNHSANLTIFSYDTIDRVSVSY